MFPREMQILDYCRDRTVLDLGCVDHEAHREKGKYWLHKRIKDVAKDLVGIDCALNEIGKLRKKGYNIKYHNVESFNLRRKFDVIVAGELIEHLLNFGNFLDCCKAHMHENSILIITTPNCFALRRMIGSYFLGRLRENKEHTCYFSNTTLKQLLERKGFIVENQDYYCGNDVGFKAYVERVLTIIPPFGFLYKPSHELGLFFISKKSR